MICLTFSRRSLFLSRVAIFQESDNICIFTVYLVVKYSLDMVRNLQKNLLIGIIPNIRNIGQKREDIPQLAGHVKRANLFFVLNNCTVGFM